MHTETDSSVNVNFYIYSNNATEDTLGSSGITVLRFYTIAMGLLHVCIAIWPSPILYFVSCHPYYTLLNKSIVYDHVRAIFA